MRFVNLDTLAGGLSWCGMTGAFIRRARTKRLVTVLCLHRVSPDVHSLFPALAPELFRDLCRYLKPRYHIIRFRDLGFAPDYRPEKPLLIISFDDGYKDFVEYALPILLDEGLKANQNIITSCADSGQPYTWQACIDLLSDATDADLGRLLDELGAGSLWKRQTRECLALDFTRWFQELTADEIQVIAERLRGVIALGRQKATRMMAWDDIRALDRLGFEIGSHTVSHASLDKLSPEQVDRELRLSKRQIEEQVGHEISVVAFPRGRFDVGIVKRSRELGYEYLLTTEPGLNDPGGDLWRRILVHGATRARLRVQAIGLESQIRKRVRKRVDPLVACARGDGREPLRHRVRRVGASSTREGLVSVVVPMFNAEPFVGEAVRSVIDQT